MTEDLPARFGRGLAWNYAGRIGEFGLRFLFVSLVAKRLGPGPFGVYSFAASVVAAGTLLGALGYEQALNNFIPTHRGDDERQTYILRRILGLRVLVFAALSLVGAALAPLFVQWLGPVASGVVWALPYLFGFNVANLLAYFWVGKLDLKLVAVVRISTQAANLGLAWWLLGKGYGPEAMLLLIGITASVAAVVLLIHTRKYLSGPESPQPMGRIHRFAVNLGVTNGINYLLGQQSDVALLGLLIRDTEQLGLYNLAATLNLIVGTALLIGFEGVSQSALAEMAVRGKSYVRATWRTLIKLTALLAVPVSAFAAIHAGKIVGLYGAGYAQAEPLLRAYLGFTLVARFLGGGTNTATLYAIREEHWPLRIRAVTGLLNLALALLLIPRMDAMGAVLATGVALLLTVSAETAVTVARIGAAYPVRFAVLTGLCTALAAAASYPLTGPGLLRLFAGAAAFLAVFAVAFALSRPLEPEDAALARRLSSRVARWTEKLVGPQGAP